MAKCMNTAVNSSAILFNYILEQFLQFRETQRVCEKKQAGRKMMQQVCIGLLGFAGPVFWPVELVAGVGGDELHAAGASKQFRAALKW